MLIKIQDKVYNSNCEDIIVVMTSVEVEWLKRFLIDLKLKSNEDLCLTINKSIGKMPSVLM